MTKYITLLLISCLTYKLSYGDHYEARTKAKADCLKNAQFMTESCNKSSVASSFCEHLYDKYSKDCKEL